MTAGVGRGQGAVHGATIGTMTSFHESADFIGPLALKHDLQDDVFRYCTFEGLNVEGQGFEGIALDCTFKNSSWYWSLFNTARFVEVEFTGCVFRGCGFAGCIFTRCRFVNCQFTKSNLGADCTFDDCSGYDCEQTVCQGLPTNLAKELVS
jgi:uncharacterized protein YjbI with pentapeptide repeats